MEKAAINMALMKLLLIEWLDSAQPLPNWRFLDDLPPIECINCRSVGWLIAETEKVVMLAPNIGNNGEQASGFIRIPVRSIVSKRTLKP
jgi:hypothetical protein